VRLHGLRGELAGQVRQAFLSAEIGAVVSGRAPRSLTEPLSRHAWTAADRHSATELIEQAANTISPDRMDLLLRVSTSFEIEPRVSAIPDAVHRFATWWADHPVPPLDPTAWPCQAPLIAQLRDELARRPDSAALRGAIRQYWWRLLLPVVDPSVPLGISAPLNASVAAAAMECGAPEIQHRVFQTVLEFAQHSNRPDTGDLAWDALFRYLPPTTDQLFNLLARLHRNTTSKSFVSTVLTTLMQRSPGQVTHTELTVLDRLADLGWDPSDNSRLSNLRHQDVALQRWLASVPARNPRQAGDDAAGLRIVTEEVFWARQPEVLRAVLDVPPLAHAPEVVDNAGGHLRTFLLKKLPELWNDQLNNGLRGDTAVAVTFIIAVSELVSDELFDRFLTRFQRWSRSIDSERLDRVEEQLRDVDSEVSQYYRQTVDDARRKMPRTKLTRTPPSSPRPALTENVSTTQTAPEKDTAQAKKSRWPFRDRRRKK
jgi:hypothetical protein